MITKRQSNRLRKLIQQLVEAEVADSWKGSGDPADIPEIQADLRIARMELDAYIGYLEQS